MSKSAQAIQVNRSSSSTRCWLGMRIGKRTAFRALAVGLLGAGLALNWNWLVAAGIAPRLVALAPCAVMCALGLCMRKGQGESCSKKVSPEQDDAPAQIDERPGEGQDQSGRATEVIVDSARRETEAGAHVIRTTVR